AALEKRFPTLKLLITLVVIVTLAGTFFTIGQHLRSQMAARPQPQAALLRPAGGAPKALSLETIEETILGFYLRSQAERLQQPASRDGTLVPFRVEPGETAATIADRLQAEGLITDAQLFRLYMRYYGIDSRLEAGDFELSPSMTMPEIAQRLQRARVEEVVVTIPEGLRMEEIAELLSREAVLDGDRFLALARTGDPAAVGLGPYPFLNSRPQGASLEGYLFPDTYRLPALATPTDLLERMLDNFGAKVTPEMQAAAADQGLTLYQVVTLASIVEREAVQADERPLIASVYLNRLAAGMRLEADPTVQYAMGYQPLTGQWWKTPVTLEEYSSVDSPYNTYLHDGLP
ncbi:MAG TPA: endolytic transglycosylase MltG, partial [Anaerolineae bacterium]|nr:endolytic transglycosylase MltG [Anaerolineae bacterium]